jgi:tellurite resistance protein TehA-like permease
MYLFRWIILLALLVSAGLFLVFALTGQEKFKKIGLAVLKIALGVAFLFFAVLIFERL